MPDPNIQLHETDVGDADPTNALLNLLEFSERWIRTYAADARAEAERLNAHINKLTDALAARDKDIAEAGAEQDKLRSERDGLLTRQDELLLERSGLLAGRNELLAERDKLSSEWDRLLVELEQRDRVRTDLEHALATAHTLLTDKEAEIGRLLSSRSWRLTQPLRNVLLTARTVTNRRTPAPPG